MVDHDDTATDGLPLGYSASILRCNDADTDEDISWIDSDSIGSSLILQNARRVLFGPGQQVAPGLKSLLKRKGGTSSSVRIEDKENVTPDKNDTLEAILGSENSCGRWKARKRNIKTKAQANDSFGKSQNDALIEAPSQDDTMDSVLLHFVSQNETQLGTIDEIIAAKTPKKLLFKSKKRVSAPSFPEKLCAVDEIEEYCNKSDSDWSRSVNTTNRRGKENEVSFDSPDSCTQDEPISPPDSEKLLVANTFEKKDGDSFPNTSGVSNFIYKRRLRRSSVAKAYIPVLTPVDEDSLPAAADQDHSLEMKEPPTNASRPLPCSSTSIFKPFLPPMGSTPISVTRRGRKVAPPPVMQEIHRMLSLTFSHAKKSNGRKRKPREVADDRVTRRSKDVASFAQKSESPCQPRTLHASGRQKITGARKKAKSISVPSEQGSVPFVDKTGRKGKEIPIESSAENFSATSPEEVIKDSGMEERAEKSEDITSDVEARSSVRQRKVTRTSQSKDKRKKSLKKQTKASFDASVQNKTATPEKKTGSVEPLKKTSDIRTRLRKRPRMCVENVATILPKKTTSRAGGDKGSLSKKPDAVLKNEKQNKKRGGASKQKNRNANKISVPRPKKANDRKARDIVVPQKKQPVSASRRSEKKKVKGREASKQTNHFDEKVYAPRPKKSDAALLMEPVVLLKRCTTKKTTVEASNEEIQHFAVEGSSVPRLNRGKGRDTSSPKEAVAPLKRSRKRKVETRVTNEETGKSAEKIFVSRPKKSIRRDNCSTTKFTAASKRGRRTLRGAKKDTIECSEKVSPSLPEERKSDNVVSLPAKPEAAPIKVSKKLRKDGKNKGEISNKKTKRKAVWNSYKKGKLKKLVNNNIGWDEIARELGFPAQECEEVYVEMFKRKPNPKVKAKETGAVGITAKPGTLKHRRQVKQTLEEMKNPKPLFQDAFAGGGTAARNGMFSTDLFTAPTLGSNFVLATPNSRPPVGFDETIATPAWFKTPTAGVAVGEMTPSTTAVTPAALKEMYSPNVDVGDKDEKSKIADRVIVQMKKKMLKGTLRDTRGKKAGVERGERRKRQNCEIDFEVLREARSHSADEEEVSGVEEYFDLSGDGNALAR